MNSNDNKEMVRGRSYQSVCPRIFVPAVIETAAAKSPELKKKYEAKVNELLAQPEHTWRKGLKPEESEALRKEYKARYNQ